MALQSVDTASRLGIEIRSFHCPACANVVYEMTEHEVGKCVHCGQGFHSEMDVSYEPDKYYLVLDPKTGAPRIEEETPVGTCPGCGWPLMP